MTCAKCQREMTRCICDNADERLASLLGHPNLDQNWIKKLQAQRFLNRFDIERDRKAANERHTS